MAVQPDDFLFLKRNRLFADMLANGVDRTYRVRLADGFRIPDLQLTVDDLVELVDPHYAIVERHDETIVEQHDGRIYVELRNVLFNFGEGPDPAIDLYWGWVTYECVGIAERIVGAFPLPFRYTVSTTSPTFTVTPRIRIGDFGRGERDAIYLPP